MDEHRLTMLKALAGNAMSTPVVQAVYISACAACPWLIDGGLIKQTSANQGVLNGIVEKDADAKFNPEVPQATALEPVLLDVGLLVDDARKEDKAPLPLIGFH